MELLVAMAVGGALLAGLVTSIYQVSWYAIRTRDQVVAQTDIDFATLWLKKDIPMAATTDLTDLDPVPRSSVTLTWTDSTGWAPPETASHTSTYALSGTQLLRTYDGAVTIAGRQITYLGFTQSGRIISVVITATGPGISRASETLKFTVKMLPEGS
ncbi:MAG: hypothetical protein Q8P00_03735 [Dehalococcoidia bacterium]|nr:hypothetical protein [Dehalococcoidia bacterium]